MVEKNDGRDGNSTYNEEVCRKVGIGKSGPENVALTSASEESR